VGRHRPPAALGHPSSVRGVLVVSYEPAQGNLAWRSHGGRVSDGEYGHDSGHRSPRSVEVRVAAKLENLAVLRTVVGAVGTYEDLDFDSVADLRLAVDEACTRLIRSATPDATLVLVVPTAPT